MDSIVNPSQIAKSHFDSGSTKREHHKNKIVDLLILRFKDQIERNHCNLYPTQRKDVRIRRKRVCSPMINKKIDKRLRSPIITRDTTFSLSPATNEKRCMSPIANRHMFINYTKEQMKLLENISNKIAEAKVMKVSNFKSPVILSRTLQLKAGLSKNKCCRFIKAKNRNSDIGNLLLNAKHNTLFGIKNYQIQDAGRIKL